VCVGLVHLDGAEEVAAPVCSPTAVLVPAAPRLEAGLASAEGMVADCLSGVSGAGRSVRAELTSGAVDEGVRAYGGASHRHRPEIEMALDLRLGGEHRVVFTPHLVPMQRGILATVTLAGECTTEEARRCLADFYRGAPFVGVIDQPP